MIRSAAEGYEPVLRSWPQATDPLPEHERADVVLDGARAGAGR